MSDTPAPRAGGPAMWVEQRVLLPVARLCGRRLGTPAADHALYWLNRGLGHAVGADDLRRSRIGAHELVMPIGDHDMRLTYLAGRYEPDVEHLVDAVLRPGDIAVDVGANIGWHTMRFAAAVGPGGHVFAFEPGARARALLTASVELNAWTSRVTVHAEAVGEREGIASLYSDGAAGLMNSTHAHGWLQAARAASVPITTLDATLLPELGGSPRLMKIDVEGAEPEVLRGGAALFDAAPPAFLIVELSSIRDAQQTLDLLTGYGYEPVALRDGRLRAAPLRAPESSTAKPGEPSFEFSNACFRRRATPAA